MAYLPEFCNHVPWNERLASLADKYIHSVGENNIVRLYELFAEFYRHTGTVHYHSHEKYIFDIDRSLISPFDYYQPVNDLTYIGIDLPVYLNYKEENRKIMIVAVDPLRSGEQFRH